MKGPPLGDKTLGLTFDSFEIDDYSMDGPMQGILWMPSSSSQFRTVPTQAVSILCRPLIAFKGHTASPI